MQSAAIKAKYIVTTWTSDVHLCVISYQIIRAVICASNEKNTVS